MPPAHASRPNHTDHGEGRRAQLIDRASELFKERGYGATRMTDIARAAGVAKSLLYWYFPSKEALLAAVGKQVVYRLRVTQEAALAGLDHPLERIYTGVLVTMRYADDNYRLYGILYRASAPAPDSVFGRSLLTHARDTASVIAEGQQRGLIRDDETAHQLSCAVSALVNELLRFHHLGLVCSSIEETAGLAARLGIDLLARDRRRAKAIAESHGSLARRASEALAA